MDDTLKIMTATEALDRLHRRIKEGEEHFREIAREAKEKSKAQLRDDIAHKDYSRIWGFCMLAHPAVKKAMAQQVAYGKSNLKVNHSLIKWVQRYFLRLTGDRL